MPPALTLALLGYLAILWIRSTGHDAIILLASRLTMLTRFGLAVFRRLLSSSLCSGTAMGQ